MGPRVGWRGTGVDRPSLAALSETTMRNRAVPKARTGGPKRSDGRSRRLGRRVQRWPASARRASGERDEVARGVDRDGEAQTLGIARDRRVDTDDGARCVEQRPAAVAGIDGGVRLDQVIELG